MKFFSQRLAAAIGMEFARLADAPLQARQTLGGALLKLTTQIGTLIKDIHGIARQIHPVRLSTRPGELVFDVHFIAELVKYAIKHHFVSL
jgi:hypothetical protein